jgi:ubiquinone/menaquinone biosynthesis C-methylase UbiE
MLLSYGVPFLISTMTHQPTTEPVRAQYNRWAASYDQFWYRYVNETLRFLKAWAQIEPTVRVLDVACGTGAFARLLLADQPEQHIVGIDVAERMLAMASETCPLRAAVYFGQARAESLPFTAQQFDLVISANSFHYFDNPEGVVSEMGRVVRPGGQIIILDWCRDYLLCRLCDAVLRLIDPAHRNCYTEAELHHLLRSNGLQIVAGQRKRFGLLWGLMVVRAQC